MKLMLQKCQREWGWGRQGQTEFKTSLVNSAFQASKGCIVTCLKQNKTITKEYSGLETWLNI